MATTYYTDIQKLYVAYFNRPADVAGLAYWETVVEANKGSTAAVSASFAGTAEYKATFAGMTNDAIVAKVYQNLFGHAPDAPGLKYWSDLMTANKITVDGVVTQVAGGALTTDLTTYNNKVTAASAFTAALDLPAEQVAYANPISNAAGATFIAGVTTDATLAAAVAPASLNATVAAITAAGTPFTLTDALATLQAANAAKVAYLDAADGTVDGAVSATAEADITAAVATKAGLVGAKITASSSAGYVAATPAIKAALLSDQIAINAKAVSDAQAVVATDNLNIAKIPGLSSAVAAEAATASIVKAAGAIQVAADADLAAKIASFNVLNAPAAGTTKVLSVDATGAATLTTTVGAGTPTVVSLIKLDATTNKLVLDGSGITETKYPGITALLASSNAHETADAGTSAAAASDAAMMAQIHYLDQTAVEVTQLAGIATAMNADIAIAAGSQPTLAQISTEQAILAARSLAADQAVTASAAANAGTASTASLDAQTVAHSTEGSFNTLVTNYKAIYVTDTAVAQLTTDTGVVTSTTATAKALTDAVTALNTATAAAAQLTAVNGSIDAANAAFTNHGLSLPVSANGSLIAGAGSDIFVAGSTNASIALFGLQGNDSLFIGNKYTLNADITKGNDSALEVFFVQNGANVDVKMETKVFGSNSADAEITITLTGTTVDHENLANGIITDA
ncbi:MAG: hypothetical protein JWQ01_1383 [Massilia sp.]|nr:hypothetical protein [Massilia sp.]